MNEKYEMKRYQLVSLLIIMLLLCSYIGWARHNNVNRDPFYKDSGWDAMRIPLLKPYEMLKLNPKLEINRRLGWSISLHIPPSEKEIYYYLEIHDIRKFAIQNGVIMVYTTYPEEVDTDAGQKVLYWFVIVPDQKIETGFDTEVEFLNSVQADGIKQPNWIEPDTAYKQFAKTGCLEWVSGCK